MDVPGWPGHQAGQHVEIRLTAEDGYRAQRSYSIANAPEEPGVAITVERLDDGEVSPVPRRGGPGGRPARAARPDRRLVHLGRAATGGPLLLVAGGSGLVPLMAMLRHRRAAGSDAPARLLLSAQRPEVVLYDRELAGLGDDRHPHLHPRRAAGLDRRDAARRPGAARAGRLAAAERAADLHLRADGLRRRGRRRLVALGPRRRAGAHGALRRVGLTPCAVTRGRDPTRPLARDAAA